MQLKVKHSLFIIYVKDQELSTSFYSKILQQTPSLNVPGMTEFTMSETSKLGIMPNSGIEKIICPTLPFPSESNHPRCEIYWTVEDVNEVYQRAISHQAKSISKPLLRDWGHIVAYVADPDNHVIAFAQIP